MRNLALAIFLLSNLGTAAEVAKPGFTVLETVVPKYEPSELTILARDVYAGSGKPRRLVEQIKSKQGNIVRVTFWGEKDGRTSVSTWHDGKAASLTVSREMPEGAASEFYTVPRALPADESEMPDRLKQPFKMARFTHKEVSRVEGTRRVTEAYVLGTDGKFNRTNQSSEQLVTLKSTLLFGLVFPTISSLAAADAVLIYRFGPLALEFFELEDGDLTILKSCKRSGQDFRCDAYRVGVRGASLRKLAAGATSGGISAGGAVCSGLGGSIRVGLSTAGNERGFCFFKDSSMVALDSLGHYAKQNDLQ